MRAHFCQEGWISQPVDILGGGKAMSARFESRDGIWRSERRREGRRGERERGKRE